MPEDHPECITKRQEPPKGKQEEKPPIPKAKMTAWQNRTSSGKSQNLKLPVPGRLLLTHPDRSLPPTVSPVAAGFPTGLAAFGTSRARSDRDFEVPANADTLH
ncbi:hypothetical protein NDU88_007675 [Pleurodeles waltl]|uniref:Uncharacterized protein n=1 Tax=Pleurodeles waltl TaxID=8319 RepID=A0AAV7VT40_PLEWA|nr:hypothetical protein NDU88_007675 [Pleurodeles waltl]